MMQELEFNLLDYRAEDGGILDLWNDHCGADWMYVTGYEAWYKWTGTHWQRDDTRGIERQIEKLTDSMNRAAKEEAQQAALNKDEARAKIFLAYVQATKRTRARIASVEAMAASRKAVAAGSLDNGNLLNLKNGTLDLDTITLRPHNKDDHLTHVLSHDYDPQARCPRFEQFLQEVLVKEQQENGAWVTDMELCELIQAAMGYSLTNEVNHEAMFWLSGIGGNGKSVLIKVMQKLLGDLAMSLNFANLGTTDGNYRLADLRGKRVVFCTESPKNSSLAEETLKQIADGSTIDARPIHGKPIQFRCQSKILWAMNDRPNIKDSGNAIWRRLHLVPFHRVFDKSERDIHLSAKLDAEISGVLNFALDGLRQLREWGQFPEATAVVQALKQYKHESNPVAQWLDERCTPLDEATTLANTLYEDYKIWATANGRQALNSTNLGKELKTLQVKFRENARGPHDNKVGNRYALMLRASDVTTGG